MVHSIQSVCICGAGTMGSGIAQAVAQSGIPAILFDLNSDVLQKASHAVEKNLDSLVFKKRISAEDKARISRSLTYTTDLNGCIADIIIEAIIEKKEAKVALFNQLAEINHSETVFASNTSSLSVTAIAESVQHPSRIAGMHFFNPATIMQLVEVISTRYTDARTTAMINQLALLMGKTAVACKDAPGFIVNRVARHYYLEALKLAGLHGDFASIDLLMEATGFKMGPFRLMDLIGNDINYAVTQSLYEASGKAERFIPSPIQQQKVEAGELGRKTGKGYYTYP